MHETVNLLNIEINSISKRMLLENLDGGIVFTPNVDHLVKLQNDPEFYDAYQRADFILCDSRIVRGVSRFLGNPIKEVIAGSDLLGEFCHYHANNRHIKIFLLGAADGVASKAMDNINSKIGREIVVGAHSPSFGFELNDVEGEEIVAIINNSDANVLVVGVGAPKQEKWIVKYKDSLKRVKVYLALGATLDFEAGNVKRAPAIIQKVGMEWLFRLIMEPRRLWRRYLIEDMPFFLYVIRQKLKLYENPFSRN